jgi:hypothetical protein
MTSVRRSLAHDHRTLGTLAIVPWASCAHRKIAASGSLSIARDQPWSPTSHIRRAGPVCCATSGHVSRMVGSSSTINVFMVAVLRATTASSLMAGMT